MEKVVFTTGGTGGHIYPALSIAKKVRERGIDTLLLVQSIEWKRILFQRKILDL